MCRTSDDLGCWPLCLLSIDAELARRLLAYRQAVAAARQSVDATDLYLVAHGRQPTQWGHSELEEVVQDEDWYEVGDDVALTADDRCGEGVHHADEQGVEFHNGSWHGQESFWTPCLTWAQLEAIADGKHPCERLSLEGEE
jgi:hypothetical protein